jgi:5-oxoprolinase (ATP-hydrolysing)
LRKFSLENNLKEVDTVINTEYMDDGTPIKLALTINRQERNAVFNFEGTGFEVIGNTNAPRSITRSAILYCLRALIGEDIPLNSGCLRPLTIIIPDHTILSPSK